MLTGSEYRVCQPLRFLIVKRVRDGHLETANAEPCEVEFVSQFPRLRFTDRVLTAECSRHLHRLLHRLPECQ